jgi:hypothetical protein
MALWATRRNRVFVAVLQWAVLQPRASSSWSPSSIAAASNRLSSLQQRRLLWSSSSTTTTPISSQRTLSSWPLRVSLPVLEQEEEKTAVDAEIGGTGTVSSSPTTRILADWDAFIKPERDPRKYRVLVLSNNLQVLLVCDEMTSGIGVEAASVHVQAGHFDDTIPGLARKFLVIFVHCDVEVLSKDA